MLQADMLNRPMAAMATESSVKALKADSSCSGWACNAAYF